MIEAFRGRRRAMAVPLADIRRPNQTVRTEVGDVASLEESIREVGVLVPILLSGAQPPYRLVAGERRVIAADMAGLQTIPAILMELDEEASQICAIVENIQREDLDPIDQALAFERLIQQGMPRGEVARVLGKCDSWIRLKLELLRFPKKIQSLVRSGELPQRIAHEILQRPQSQWKVLAEEAIAGQLNLGQLRRERGLKTVQNNYGSDMVISALRDALKALRYEDYTQAVEHITAALGELGASPKAHEQEERDERIIDLRLEGLSHADIAERSGVNVTVVGRILQKHGLMGGMTRVRNVPSLALPEQQRNEFHRMRTDGMPVSEIARALGVDRVQLHKWRKSQVKESSAA